jgi:hypothetical protein
MFFLFQVINQNLILGFIPESLGLLIFGVGLVFLTIGLRWIMKRGEKSVDGEIEKMAEKVNR